MTILLNKNGYEPFLDFLKAYAIIGVLLGHTIPYLDETGYSLWYGMQVPLFVLIQTFHVFKKETYQLNIPKIVKRVLLPYVLIQILPLWYFIYKGIRFADIIGYYTNGGGIGPGSYYPWIYLQLAFILPFVKPLCEKTSSSYMFIVFVVICEGLEILTSLLHISDGLYRLLSIRYIFLIYLGWIWVKKGIVLNTKTVLLSLFSMATIIYFEYFYKATEPWFYDTAWRTHRWPCYYYVSILLCGILYWVYNLTKTNPLVLSITKILSKCSYEIFLVQMVAIPFLPPLSFVHDELLQHVLKIIFIFIISIIGGFYFNKYYNILLENIKK